MKPLKPDPDPEYTHIRVKKATQLQIKRAAQVMGLGKVDTSGENYVGPSLNDVVWEMAQRILRAGGRL